MILGNLSISNFRSYPKRKFDFSPETTLIIGANAIGKTNLLEAVFFLSTGKSFRADKDTEMIEFGKELSRVKGVIEKSSDQDVKLLSNQASRRFSDQTIELEIVLTNGEVMGIKAPVKKYSVNGVGKGLVDFTGTLKCVLFWPQDLELVTDSPGKRRRYLDFVLLQADREYRRALNSYERGIRQRNRVLEAIREEGADRKQLMFWDQLIIKDGNYITEKREEYISYLNTFPVSPPAIAFGNSRWRAGNFQIKSNPPAGPDLIGAGGQNPKQVFPLFQLLYDPSIISRERLDQYKDEEVAAGVTLVGPHRDDLIFKIKDQRSKIKDEEVVRTEEGKSRDLSQFGSRGEQRMAVLWLKLGELRFIEQITGDKPILLLDDIFSELDHPHREIIFDIIGSQQTVMTTTDIHLIDKRILEKVEIIRLGNG